MCELGVKDLFKTKADRQFEILDARLIDVQGKLRSLKAEVGAIFEIVEKLQPLPQPQPKQKGTIVADYQIPDDQPDGRVTYHLKATDAEGNVITDPAQMAQVGFTVQSSNEAAFIVTLDADQPDPFNRVGGYHSGAPGQAALTSNMTNAKGELIGTGTDGFTVTTGAVTLGSVESTFDGLTPIGG